MSNSASEMSGYSVEALKMFYDNTDIGVYVSDFNTGEIVVCNSIYANAFGKSVDEIIGSFCYKNLGYSERCPFCPHEKLTDKNGNPTGPYTWENYFEVFNAWLLATNRAVHWVDGKLVHMVTYVDITRRREAEDNLNVLAFTDNITLLPNSKRLERDLSSNPISKYLIVLEIQDLKRINDTYGWDSGNSLLVTIRDYLKRLEIPGGIVYRLQQGDFGIAIEKKDDNEVIVKEMAETIYSRFGSPWLIPGDVGQQAVFSGCNVCIVTVDGKNELSLRNMFGKIIYTLDLSGKEGGVVIYDGAVHEKLHLDFEIELGMKKSVRENMSGFSVAYQPVVKAEGKVWRGVEALCRWVSPELGYVKPEVFIPIAESCGLIGAIGMWMIESSIVQIKAWNLDETDEFLLNINLSLMQLAIPNLDKTIIYLLEKHDYPPEKLCLGITDSSKLNLSSQYIDVIKSLRSAKIKVALEDFGVGYYSYDSMRNMPVDLLKTNLSFIADIDSDEYWRKIFFLIKLAHSADKEIVIEGIEDEIQAQFLANQKADYFQGYLYSQPLSPEQMRDKLNKFREAPDSDGEEDGDKTYLDKLNDISYGHDLSPLVNKLLVRCMYEMFANPNTESAVETALKYIGKGIGVSRAYVFTKLPDGFYKNSHEWCAFGIEPMKEKLQCVAFDETKINHLGMNGYLATEDMDSQDGETNLSLYGNDIKASMEFPLWESDALYGFIGFGDCASSRHWTSEELQAFYMLTNIISCILGKIRLQSELNALKKQ